MRFKVPVIFLVSAAFVFAGSAEARTDRIFDADGQGYRDVTLNDNGDLVGETRYDLLGRIQKSMTVDADNDTLLEIDYENTLPKIRRVIEIGGRLVRIDRFDRKGNVLETERRDDTGPVQLIRFQYDGQGRVIQAVRLKPDGAEMETVHYTYEGSFLSKAVRTRRAERKPVTDSLVLDPSGAVLQSSGDTGDILEGSRPPQQALPPQTHEKLDRLGNRIRIKHNRNETFDVTIYDKLGRVIAWQKLRSGDCPGKELCSLVESLPSMNNPVFFASR